MSTFWSKEVGEEKVLTSYLLSPVVGDTQVTDVFFHANLFLSRKSVSSKKNKTVVSGKTDRIFTIDLSQVIKLLNGFFPQMDVFTDVCHAYCSPNRSFTINYLTNVHINI